MPFNVQEFAGAFKFGGARPSLFKVEVANPVTNAADNVLPFLAKASQIPASTLTMVPVPYMGRQLKYAGNRTFSEWPVTIINDEDFVIRNAMETWMNRINSYQGNIRTFPSSAPTEYKTTAHVTQFSKTGDELRIYQFFGLWPSDLSAIDLAFENEGIEEFNVTFQYDYFEIVGGITGNSGGA